MLIEFSWVVRTWGVLLLWQHGGWVAGRASQDVRVFNGVELKSRCVTFAVSYWSSICHRVGPESEGGDYPTTWISRLMVLRRTFWETSKCSLFKNEQITVSNARPGPVTRECLLYLKVVFVWSGSWREQGNAFLSGWKSWGRNMKLLWLKVFWNISRPIPGDLNSS